MRMRILLIVSSFLIAAGLAAPAHALPVDWSKGFVFETSGGIVNPLVIVGFNPQPEPPAGLTDLNNANPAMPVLTTVDVSAPNPFRILFGLGGVGDLVIEAKGVPNGQFTFNALDAASGANVFEILFDLTTSSGGSVDPLTWVGFNPVPEPPVGAGGAIGFDFEFDGLSQGILGFQIKDAQGNILNLTQTVIPLPAAAWMFLTALGGLGLFGWRKRSAATVAA